MKINADNYCTIQGWMRTELNLKGNDLFVYAVIYGFSQTENQKFTGSLQYLADWCGATKQGVLKNIKNLIDANLIEKHEITKNNIKFCEYSCIPLNTVEHVGIKHSLINNKANTDNKEIISKDINNIKISKNDFLGSAKSEKKPNLYTSCINLIDSFVVDNDCYDIRDLLIQHLDIAFEQKKIRGQKQYKGILNKLVEIHNEGAKYTDVIMYSIEHGYPSFYNNSKDYQKKTNNAIATESGNRHVPRFTKEDEKRLHEFQKECEKKGIRTTF